jgi:hypothetical protein
MATTIMNNSLVFTWINDVKPFPEPPSGGSNAWQSNAYSIIGNVLKTWDAGKYNNTQEVWKGIWNKVDDGKMTIEKPKIYPNPATNIATIDVNTNNPYTLTVTNIMGQVVHTMKGQQSKIELNVSNYPAGIYIVNVKTARATASQKLIVK